MSLEHLPHAEDENCDECLAEETAQAMAANPTPDTTTKVIRLGALSTYFGTSESQLKGMISAYAEFFPEQWPNGLPWPPSTPLSLVATSYTPTTVTITWADTSSDESGFFVYKLTSTGMELVADLEPNDVDVVVDNLEPNTQYSFIVASYNSAGQSLSETITTTTIAEDTVDPGDGFLSFTVNKPGPVFQGLPLSLGTIVDIDLPFLGVQTEPGTACLADFSIAESHFDGSAKILHVSFVAPQAGTYLLVMRENEIDTPEFVGDTELPFNVEVNGETLEFPPLTIELGSTVMSKGESSVLLADGVKVDCWHREYLEGPTRTFLRFTNTNPTDTHPENSNQPSSASYGMPAERSLSARISSDETLFIRRADQKGVAEEGLDVTLHTGEDMIDSLRAGESRGWEITTRCDPEPPIALASAENYALAFQDRDPFIPYDPDKIENLSYELNMIAGIKAAWSRRPRHEHWRNPRDADEDQRDWDGGVTSTDFQTHNNEYEAWHGYFLQAMRLAGSEHETLEGVDWARRAFELADAGTMHFSTVDFYDVHEGPFNWMYHMNYQHTKHGGSGTGNAHRSSFAPNTGHMNGRCCRTSWLLTGNPIAYDVFQKLTEQAIWKVEHGPGMPGIPSVDGAARNAGNVLGLILDKLESVVDNPVEAERPLSIAMRTVREHGTRSAYISPHTTGKYKPWQVAIFTNQAERLSFICLDLEEYELQEEIEGILLNVKGSLVHALQDADSEYPYLKYQMNPEAGSGRDMWNVTCADALVGYDSSVAQKLFKTGSDIIWYSGYPIGTYARLIQHTVLNCFGGRWMVSREG